MIVKFTVHEMIYLQDNGIIHGQESKAGSKALACTFIVLFGGVFRVFPAGALRGRVIGVLSIGQTNGDIHTVKPK